MVYTHIESVANRSGPVDLVAHDWGALITLRAISLRPDLIRSWAIISAVPHPDNLWHSTAEDVANAHYWRTYDVIDHKETHRGTPERQPSAAQI